MKRTTLAFGTLLVLCLAAGNAVHGALSYWDLNGTNNGAGDTPSGDWTTINDIPPTNTWAYASTGTDGTNFWNDGDIAVFSAGSDATNAYTVNVISSPLAGGLIFEDGVITLANGTVGMTNEFEFPIQAQTNATITSTLADFAGATGVLKTGPGKVTLSANNAFGGTNIVAEGTLAYTLNTALGTSATTPTIVSNGATLLQAAAVDITEAVILNGMGVSNSGALNATAVPSAGTQGWRGGAVLGSDARINLSVGTQWTWLASPITNNLNGSSVYFGGTAGTIRLNIGGRAVQVPNAYIYKDGANNLQFETPCIATGMVFNGGNIVNRSSGGNPLSGSPPIYVGPGAGQFRTGSGGPSYTLTSPIILSNAATATFAPTATFSETVSSVISGPGGVTKATTGSTLNLNAANTYSNTTTITAGNLVLGASGSIANSAVIDVQTGANFNVSAVTGGFVLGSAQTLKGNGGVQGDVTANGAVSPGASVGNLTFSNNLTLGVGATVRIEVDKSLSPSNDVVTVLGLITNLGAASVVVSNSGATPLQAGDSFQIFNQAVTNGQGFAVSGAGATWTNRLDQDGSIAVLALAPTQVRATNLTVKVVGPTSYLLGATGGTNLAYNVYAYTNVATPIANWWLIGTTNSDGAGVIRFTDSTATNAQRFYRFGQ